MPRSSRPEGTSQSEVSESVSDSIQLPDDPVGPVNSPKSSIATSEGREDGRSSHRTESGSPRRTAANPSRPSSRGNKRHREKGSKSSAVSERSMSDTDNKTEKSARRRLEKSRLDVQDKKITRTVQQTSVRMVALCKSLYDRGSPKLTLRQISSL